MANSSYLDLTNELLRRLLEAQITSTEFASVRSTQATAKDCIRAAIKEINAAEKEWPYHYQTTSQLLVVGTTEYAFPTNCKTPDWESFYLAKDDALGINTLPLRMISRDLWMQRFRPFDLDASTDGLAPPAYVFDSSLGGVRAFGITPSPDKAYTVHYEYYKKDDELSAYSDLVSIPPEFDYVTINMALKHFYAHKDNSEQASLWLKEANNSLNQMRHTLIPKKDNMVDTRVNFGGNSWKGTSYRR